MRRGEPASWAALTPEETAAAVAVDDGQRGGGTSGHAPTSFGGLSISIHDGAEERILDLFPRAIFGVAEQLLGQVRSFISVTFDRSM